MHVLWPMFHFQLDGVGYKTIRNGLGNFLVEVRSMLGQKMSNFKVVSDAVRKKHDGTICTLFVHVHQYIGVRCQIRTEKLI